MLKTYLTLRSKFRQNVKFAYWKITIPINKFFNKKYIPNFFFSIEVSNVCNFKCVFCGYQKFNGKFNIKKLETFEKNIDQVLKFTDQNITLTPLTGDVYSDKGFNNKLNYLENHPKLNKFGFTTNFTLCNFIDIEYLLSLKKIDHIKISIYGHDEDSFKKITKSNTYNKLISNLKYLSQRLESLNFNLDLAIRSYMDFNFEKYKETELISIINNMEKKSNKVKKSQHYHYTNWGGTVNKSDIGDLDIILKDAKHSYKNGPCNRLFSFLISANNEVILCACRDTHRYMNIGDLNKMKLSEIISLDNPKYKKWIDDQKNNYFEGPCKECDMYEPIYTKPLHLVLKNKKSSHLFQNLRI